jgi:peptidoglycan/LPS O-acetylase OafA/YrhL
MPSLDGLRGLSILLVLIGHSVYEHAYPVLYSVVGRFGNYGVRMFFVISGYLITTLLIREWERTSRISLVQFYVRRSLRILPAFVVFVATVLALNAFGVIRLKPGDVIHTLTYTVNYHYYRSWYVNHLWSLSVEEQFYMLWPAILVLVTPLLGLRVAVGVIVASPVIRTIMFFAFDATDTAMSRQFQAVADALAFGCALAFLYERLGRSAGYVTASRSVWFLALPFGCLVLPGLAFWVHPALYYILGVSLAYLGMALLVDHSVRHPDGLAGQVLNWAPLCFLGTISYSVYLWQELFLDNGSRHLGIGFPQNLLLTLVVSVASYYIVERQFLLMKERFSSRRSGGREPLAPVRALPGASEH